MTERMAQLQKASNRMSAPEKFLLNLLKLFILLPAFILIFRTFGDWYAMSGALLIFLLYPLILKPVQYSICAKYLAGKHN